MRFLLVSDIHKSFNFFRGHDESVAVDWLLEVISETEPRYLFQQGDWDEGMTLEDFRRISSKLSY
nr:hypothetical protein [Saccharolobus solfataricus]